MAFQTGTLTPEQRHERLRQSAQACVDALRADRERPKGDMGSWHDMQRAEMALGHALDDEAKDYVTVCPCTACRDIGGVPSEFHDQFNMKVFGTLTP